MGARDIHPITRCGVQMVQSCHQGRWRGVSLSCAAYQESLLLLNLQYARRKHRDKWVTTEELSVLRGLVGQWMLLATPVILSCKHLYGCFWVTFQLPPFPQSLKQTNFFAVR